MKNYKILNMLEMQTAWDLYGSTNSLDEFVSAMLKEFSELEDREAIMMWQGFDFMYDNFDVREFRV